MVNKLLDISSVEYVKTINVSKYAVAIRKAFNYALYGDYQKAASMITELVNDEAVSYTHLTLPTTSRV